MCYEESEDNGPYHDWCDNDFDWKSLNEAGAYLQTQCMRWARLGIQVKEKYGTLRVSDTCAYVSSTNVLHSLLHPGRYSRSYKFVSTDKAISWALTKLGIVSLMCKYQTYMLGHFWRLAAIKWPHISSEILDEYPVHIMRDYYGD